MANERTSVPMFFQNLSYSQGLSVIVFFPPLRYAIIDQHADSGRISNECDFIFLFAYLYFIILH